MKIIKAALSPRPAGPASAISPDAMAAALVSLVPGFILQLALLGPGAVDGVTRGPAVTLAVMNRRLRSGRPHFARNFPLPAVIAHGIPAVTTPWFWCCSPRSTGPDRKPRMA